MPTKAVAPPSDAIDNARAERFRTRRRNTPRPTTATRQRDHEPRPTGYYVPAVDTDVSCDLCGSVDDLTFDRSTNRLTVICADCMRVIDEELADFATDSDDDLDLWTDSDE
jgi:hypothetical protein